MQQALSQRFQLPRWNKNDLRRNMTAYGFLAPFLIVLTTFTLLAVLYAFYLSFYYVDLGFTQPVFTGLRNYKNIWYDLTHDGLFYTSLINVLKYTLAVVTIQTILALLMATGLNQVVRAKGFFRTLFYLPALTSSVAISLIFFWLYKPQGGINYVLSLIHIHGPNWLNDPSFALLSIVLLNIWTTAPTFMLLFLAALQDVPESLYEAARIDGANEFQIFLRVTVPLLRPTIFLVTALGTIGSFQVFDQVYVIQGADGTPLNSTLVPALEIYNAAFKNSSTGLACAQAFALFVVISIFVYFQRRFIDSSVEY